ncbi:delta-60 repeat domain-containing protein/Por secretion system C-terminal sorting domain-containing protein [Flavobacterium resistens]|uniref:Delta-60 repeat domain-containing protein/Por secretion system C-terminal sorting domain-containing protein n=1 Tax=Flavobacterium resistens TaxID=443612 RepID=A0A521E898_9FLAO|nr:T9SS sorting signal type C domain-containing protein [Flavobacterium resistens]SMO79400.1 delta-60 repeat domain-containing protein/Por secretion system C-terminal sorting domain-containing protein [Flavobacterium resistens]
MIRKLLYTVTLTVFLGNFEFYGQQGKIDVTFNTLDDGSIGDGFDGPVQTLSLQSDQNLIVGGEYLNLNGISSPYFTRLKPDGTIDESFHTGSGFNGKVYATYIQPDGKIVVGGSFTSYNGINAGRLIRLNTDGSYDASFNTSIGATTGIIYDIALQSDGKIIICGSFTKYNNVTTNRIARILSTGALDTSFLIGSGTTSNINNTKVLADGKILLSGNFTSFNNTPHNRLVRLNNNGSIDSSFNIGTGFDDDVNAMEVQSDGKIILGGKFVTFNGNSANRIIRIMLDGTIDSSFFTGSGFNSGAVLACKIDSVGNIMLGGSFYGNYNGSNVNRVCFLDSTGFLKDEIDFGSGPATASVFALENDAEGAWYIGGSFSVFDGLNQGRLAKIDSEGEYDTSYLTSGIGFDNSVYSILSLENAKTMVFGNFKNFNGANASRIAKLLEDGSSDPEFNLGQAGANNLIKTAVLQPDGKIILGGNFTKYNETLINRIVRILPDGTEDASFNITSGCNSQVYALAIQPDGKIIVAGGFTKYNDVNVGRIIRLTSDGLRDTSFNPGLGADAIIESVLIQPDGKILLGGRFTTFDGILFPHLVRLNSNGSIDPTFTIGDGFDKNVYAIALQSDQKIIIGGSFLNFNKVPQKRILRLNPNGSLDNTFDSGSGFSKGDVRSILVQPDDRILVAGTFSGTYKNVSALRLVRLLKSGGLDNSFSATLNNKVFSISFSSEHKLLIGGDFNSVSGISKHRIARLKLCLESTIWNGASWSNGFPSGGKELFFKDDYAALTTANVCSCTIDEDKKVTLKSGNTLSIEFSYSGLGTLVLEDSANLYQSDDDIVNTGIIHLKRNSSPILKSDYVYWSSPVENQKLFDLSPSTISNRFLTYSPTIKNWKVESVTTIMQPAIGYIIQGPRDFSSVTRESYPATFKGIPHNGKIEVNLGPANSFNLIGNPYPSTLNADVFLKENSSKIKGTIYFWTHNTPITNNKYASDDYAVYNLLGGVGTRGALSSGVNEIIPDKTIGAGQAFFVASQNSGVIEFNDKMRMKERNTSFFKPAKGKDFEENDIKKRRIWLNLKNEEDLFKQILIGYIEGATNTYDISYDAESFSGNRYVNFYSISENKNLAIQGRIFPFEKTDSVILGYMSKIEGNFNLSIDHFDDDFSETNIYLEDKELKILHNLRDSPYIFKTEKGTFDKRFELKYVNNELKVDDFKSDSNIILVAVKDKQININASQESIKEIEIFDLTGKVLYKKTKINASHFSIQNLNCGNQILFIKVTLENGSRSTRKVIF